MGLVKNLFIAGGLSLILSGCPLPYEPNKPTPTPHRSWADIEFVVEGGNGVTNLSNITYGRIDSSGNWVEGFYKTTGPVSLPWSDEYTTCTGHSERVSAVSAQNPGSLTLTINDDKNFGAQKTFDSNGGIWGGSLDYYIPSQ
jgi:hypothetical protein